MEFSPIGMIRGSKNQSINQSINNMLCEAGKQICLWHPEIIHYNGKVME
ncbi:hypothetical protein SAMN05216323_102421 [Williamwhitmania taraxaci]|uniref:Uncharacterized protein n=1 Tax=Williamwhitmania taraxaci TaxID=1640674 RepID=A0A1G6KBK9_9BACT|nr:hypothetical protein SAMN05216323_102421 [Williamwhitmania taraxaci]